MPLSPDDVDDMSRSQKGVTCRYSGFRTREIVRLRDINHAKPRSRPSQSGITQCYATSSCRKHRSSLISLFPTLVTSMICLFMMNQTVLSTVLIASGQPAVCFSLIIKLFMYSLGDIAKEDIGHPIPNRSSNVGCPQNSSSATTSTTTPTPLTQSTSSAKQSTTEDHESPRDILSPMITGEEAIECDQRQAAVGQAPPPPLCETLALLNSPFPNVRVRSALE